ncbi:LacI family DNA-binding transcriptional regulator [Paenarthrobacter sp. NyZ202]|uniref:LacI family DNA-binding transcriptional regulator n=1 Tax=Paenarthrobacter sp. NyZ202 TaxID=3402689 RepID=UPI003CE88CAF
MAVTRNDVARLAGVSPGLVSYVLNDGPRPVSAEARTRIEAAIEELGYRRDGIARYLKTGKTNSLGLVLPDIGLPYYSEITKELNARTFELGFQLLIATSELDSAREDAQLASLAERRVDGIILMSVDPERDLSSLERLGTRVVVIDRPEFAIDSARSATEHLISHGHRDIGFIGSIRLRASQRRLRGWSLALEDAGIQPNAAWIASAPITRKGGHEAAHRLLTSSRRPSALLIGSDAQAAGALRAFKDLGLGVPDDVAVVTSEGTDLARYTIPSLTSIVQPIAAIAKDAVDSVLLADAAAVARINNFSYDLALRESCGHEAH